MASVAGQSNPWHGYSIDPRFSQTAPLNFTTPGIPTSEVRRLPAIDVSNRQPPASEDTSDGTSQGQQDSAGQERANADRPIGEAPEDISEIFLRQSTILLKPGEGQIDWGFMYSWQQSRQAIVLSGGEVAMENLRDRQLTVPLNVRYGITDHVQVFAQLPVGYAIFERSDIEQDNMTSRLGTGDLVVGFKRLLKEEDTDSPDVISSVSIGAPVGNHSFHLGDTAAIGSGFWTLNAGLNFVKSFDPIVIYSGVGYTHFYEADHAGQSLQPGELFNYSFGLGFAVNDSIVLSGELIGALQTYFYVNEVRVPNSLTEPYSLRFAMTQVLCKDRFLEPYVILGLTPDAPDVQVGLFHTFGF